MNTARTTKFFGLVAAAVVAVVVNGSMLLKFDQVAHQQPQAQSAPTAVVLETVTIVARRS